MMKRFIPSFLLLTYSVILIRVMIFKVVPIITSGQVTLDFGGTNGGNPPNFIPFSTIMPYLLGENGLTIAFLNLIGNIALLVPIGFLIPYVYRNMTWKHAIALGVGVSFLIEIMQTVLRVGIFDIDDVILNALGVMIGYWAFVRITTWIREKRYLPLCVSALFIIAALAGSFYVMYPHGEQPIRPGVDTRIQPDTNTANEGNVPKTGDLCGGTGGTGQIVSMETNMITIVGKSGVPQPIRLTDKTTIRNSTGTISESNLKIGDHVTVVIMDERKIASTVLVCSEGP